MLKGYKIKVDILKVLTVPIVFKTPEGVEIIKTFTFTQGQYPIVVKHQVVNRSQQNWQGQMFGQLKRDNSKIQVSLLRVFSL